MGMLIVQNHHLDIVLNNSVNCVSGLYLEQPHFHTHKSESKLMNSEKCQYFWRPLCIYAPYSATGLPLFSFVMLLLSTRKVMFCLIPR